MNRSKSKTVAAIAIFIAVMFVIEVISQTIFLTFVALPVKPTITHIPVIVASIVYGPRIGAALGGFMGVMSLVRATIILTPYSYWFSPFVENGNFFSILIAILPRVCIGISPYLIYKFLRKYITKDSTRALLAGAVGSLTNTVLVLSGVFFFFSQVYKGNVQVFLATIFSTNALFEIFIASLLTFAIIPPLLKLKK